MFKLMTRAEIIVTLIIVFAIVGAIALTALDAVITREKLDYNRQTVLDALSAVSSKIDEQKTARVLRECPPMRVP